MKWLVLGIAVVAVAAAGTFAGLYFTKDSESKPVAAQPCGDERSSGTSGRSCARVTTTSSGSIPAWFTSGVTANTAAAEDGAVEPGEPVPNDNYVVDESRPHAEVPRASGSARDGAHQRRGPGSSGATSISVAELAEIVQTGKSSRRKLFESLESGVWIRYRIDTVCALDQQYRP